MTIQFSLVRKAPARADLHVVPVTKEQVEAQSAAVDWEVLARKGFDGSVGALEIVAGSTVPIALVGLGSGAEVTASTFRRAGAAIARASSKLKKISVESPDTDMVDKTAGAAALAEGVVLGSYAYLAQKSSGTPSSLKSVMLVGTGGAKITEAMARGADIATAVNLARDLVNEPGGSLTPTRFAQEATKVARGSGNRLKVTVMDMAAIKRAKLGGLLGVNRGSQQQPRFVRMVYTPNGKANGHLALVGKGVTFDAGGLSIKTGAGMMTMKCDMGGAAAVVGAMSALGALAPQVKVTAYIPLTDNMLGPDATRPGDVLTIRGGKTVEVLNTDAEGRLILADALSMASDAKPDAIVDLATLTGACMVALGPKIAGLMSNDEGWRDQVEVAAEATAESVWPLPLPPEYRKMLDSPVADMKNIGGAHAGALTAGLFLQEFVAEGIPWAHLDIAGPAFSDSEGTDHPKGATGFGVRLLIDLVENFTKPT